MVREKSERRFEELLLCAYFGLSGERNRMSVENEEMSIQSLKNIFLSTLLLWVKLYIGDGSMSLVNFVEWLTTYQGREVFLQSYLGCSLTLFLLFSFALSLYTFDVLCRTFAFLMNYIIAYQKKKKMLNLSCP